MKKILMCIVAATLCVGAWGTEVVIDDGNTETTSNAPFNTYYKYNLVQIIYLQSNLSGSKAGNITSISFKYAGSSISKRKLDIYISNTSATKFTSFVAVTEKQKVFSGEVSENANNWYSIALDTPFAWDGNSNIMVTIDDNTGSFASEYKHYKNNLNSFSVQRVAYYKHTSGTDDPNINPINPSSHTATICADEPKVKFTIEESSEPIVVPTLNPSTNSLDLGTFMQGEIVSNTFTLSASDLTDDVTLTASAGLTVSPSSFTKEQLATAQTVTVSSTSTFNFPYSSSVTIKSEGAADAKVTISATNAGDYANAFTLATLTNDENIGKYYNYMSNATIVSVSSNTMVISQSSHSVTLDFSAIGGSYAANGTVTNIKGKLTASRQFKALEAFTYNPPAMTGVTIEEDADNSETLADEAENVNVTLNRAALQKNMFNTFCVPFDISKTLVETKFAGCDIITLASSAYNDGVISLTFEECTQMEAGQPYLINPKNQDISFTFNGCDIQNVASGSVETELVDFIGIVNPTELPHSKEILFMGLNNELFWPTEAGTLKGLRCYFKVKFEGTPEGSPMQGAPVRMTINRENTATRLGNSTKQNAHCSKMIHNGRLIINRNGKMFNIQGIQL